MILQALATGALLGAGAVLFVGYVWSYFAGRKAEA